MQNKVVPVHHFETHSCKTPMELMYTLYPISENPQGLHKAVVHTPNSVYPILKAPPGLVTGRGKSPFYIGTGIKLESIVCC